jgi:hypothetical protein
VVVGGVAVTLLTMGYLHVVGATVVDPLDATISDYVHVPGGYLLLALAAFALAASVVALAAGLAPAGLPDPLPPTRLLLSGSAALVLVALFPTNAPDTPAGVVANIHRVAGAWVLAALPLAGRMVAGRARQARRWLPSAARLTWVAGGTTVLSAGFMLSHVPIVIGMSPGVPLLGGAERVLYAAVLVVVLVTARTTRCAVEESPDAAGAILDDPTDIGRVA